MNIGFNLSPEMRALLKGTFDCHQEGVVSLPPLPGSDWLALAEEGMCFPLSEKQEARESLL